MRIGDYVGCYRLMRLLAQGGMGAVYEGLNEQLDRRVAVKLMHPSLAGDREQCVRFFNEARVVNLIRHPSLVSIHEFGRLPDGNAYIVMEYLDGQTLSQRMREHGDAPLPVRKVVRIARQVAAALAAAHAKNIVHRDLKPDNLMLIGDPEVTDGERVKILDFGIAKVRRPQSVPAPPGTTRAGTWMGTPGYIAPEQIYGANSVDGRADVYSLGVILYELLSGTRPFRAGSAEQEMRLHMTAVPTPLLTCAPATPPALAALVHEMLAKRSEERPTMGELVDHLHAMEFSTQGSTAVGQTTPRPVALRSIAGLALAVTLLVSIFPFVLSYLGRAPVPLAAAAGYQPSPAGFDAGLADFSPLGAPAERSGLVEKPTAPAPILDIATQSKPTPTKHLFQRKAVVVKDPLNPHEIHQLK